MNQQQQQQQQLMQSRFLMVPLPTGPQNQQCPLTKTLGGLILVLLISHQMLSQKQRKLLIILSCMTFTISCRQSIVQEGEVPTSHLPGNDGDSNIISWFKFFIYSQEVAQSLPDTEDPVNQGYR